MIENEVILLGKDHRNISSVEKQRLFLALAIYKNPKVLLLDEPTSSLDKKVLFFFGLYFISIGIKGLLLLFLMIKFLKILKQRWKL